MSSTTIDSPVHGKISDHEGSSGVEADEKVQSAPTPLEVEGAVPSAPLTGSNNNPNIVDFDGPDDPYRPLNWPMRKKLITTALYSATTMGSTWASTM